VAAPFGIGHLDVVKTWWAVIGGTALVGCAAKPVPTPAHPVIEATPIVITPHDDETLEQAFERARALLIEGKGAEAAPIFDRIAQAAAAADGAKPAPSNITDAKPAPNHLAPLALFNAGIAWELAGNRSVALSRFASGVERFSQGDVGKWSALRAARLQAYLERWSELSAMADLLLARGDLLEVERLEAYGAKALAVVESGDPESAQRFVNKGRDIVDALRLGEGGKLPLEVAQIHFALGEVRKVRSETVTFVPMPGNFAAALETRCQGLLDAQSAYSDAMRSYDAHWAAMSGYRIGQLYEKLYRDVLSIPPPRAATTTEKKRLFEGAMRLRYRVLLEKGLKMMEHTVMVGDRTGEASSWIERARAAKREIEKALEQQKELLAKLPYGEKELQRALEDLAAKTAP